MRKLVFGILFFAIVLIRFEAKAQCSCENSDELSQAQLLLCENFESYVNGSPFPTNNPRWNLWPSPTPDLAKIQPNPTLSSNKALYIQRNGVADPDLLLKLGDRTSGRYRLSWQMFIAKDKTAYYNIQHEEKEGHWAFQVNFDANGIGSVFLHSDTPVSSFPYFKGAWNTIMHIIDLDNDEIELWVNNEFVDAWKFSLGTKGNGQINYGSKLGAVNFYADGGAEFYVDNICMWQKRSSNINIITVYDPVCVKNGTSFYSPAEARHYSLYTSLEYERGDCDPICNWGGDLPSGVTEINSEDYLPNTILRADCLKDKFDQYSAKQLKGEIFPLRYYGRGLNPEVTLTITHEEGSIDDVHVMLYDCNSSSCLEPINIAKNVGKVSFTFIHEGESGRIIVLSPKKIKYTIAVNYSNIIMLNDCINYPVTCNCGEARTDGVMRSLEIGKPSTLNFSNFKYPVTTYAEVNTNTMFLGAESIASFYIEKASWVNIQLTAATNGVGMVLYSQGCGFGLIDFSQSGNNGGSASIQRVLEPGQYYVYFNLIQNRSAGTVTVRVDAQPTEVPINGGAAKACPVIVSKSHKVTIRGTPLLLDGNPLKLSDRILAFSNNNSLKQSFESISWNGSEVTLDLIFDAPNDNLVCGFQENEVISFEIIRGTQVIPVQPIFQPVDQTITNASNLFKNGGKSLIIGFYSRQETAYINIQSLPRLRAGSGYFLVDLSTSDDWSIKTNPQKNWVKVSPLQGEKGYGELEFIIAPNPFTSSRKDTLYIVDSKGNNRPIILEQPGCTGPSITADPDQSYCANQSISLTATGIGTISWRNANGSTIASGSRLNTTVTSTQTFTAISTLNGCTAIDEVMITIASANAGPDQTICAGAQAILRASGGTSYSWSNGGTGAETQVNPTQTTSYTVTVSQNGCINTASVLVRVNPKPLAYAGPDKSICQGVFTTLNASGGGTYSWSTRENKASINVSPPSTRTYRLTVTLNGCENTDSTVVTVYRKPVITLADSRLVFGPTGYIKVLVHDGTPSYRYTWFLNNNPISNQKDLFGLNTGVYKLVVTDARGCSSTFGPQVISIAPKVEPSLSANIRLFPNPSNGILHLQFDLDQSALLEINILDGLGRSTWSQVSRPFYSETLDVDLSQYPAGVYWVLFKTPNGTFYKKILRL